MPEVTVYTQSGSRFRINRSERDMAVGPYNATSNG